MTRQMEDFKNFSLALGSSAFGIVFTHEFVMSLLLTVTLFFVGKGIDIVVKPVVDDWRRKKKRRKRV